MSLRIEFLYLRCIIHALERDIQTPVTKEEVYAEIDEARKTFSYLPDYFNNLILHFSGMVYRHSYEASGENDRTPGDDPRYSPLRRSQTGREVHQSIDEALLEAGFELENTRETVMELRDNGQLEQMLIPVYVNLRVRGYNLIDFWT